MLIPEIVLRTKVRCPTVLELTSYLETQFWKNMATQIDREGQEIYVVYGKRFGTTFREVKVPASQTFDDWAEIVAQAIVKLSEITGDDELSIYKEICWWNFQPEK